MRAPARIEAALTGASTVPFWLDRPDRPTARDRVPADLATDLLIVGGGFSGLWTAVLAKERDPQREVVLIEGERIGWAASGRNGGFCSASLTHGTDNGAQRFPDEIDEIERLGLANLDEIEQTIARYGIDCDYQRTGSITVATEPYQVEALRQAPHGEFLTADEVRAKVNSPTYLAGLQTKHDNALIDPARLVWGLARVAEELGVRIFEHTTATGLQRSDGAVRVRTGPGPTITADRVALGTNAFPALVKRTRLCTVPVYDYVLVTEPLTEAQLAAIGWTERQGLDDSANQFHYYRLTADNRILWGGYDAIYHFGRQVKGSYDQRPATFAKLAEHFFQTFPQLDGLRFSHHWGGAIDTSTRFFAFFGTAYDARIAYALGYTGLGVGATRFGANVMLDLLSGQPTERTALRMVRSRPLPFPPEPLAYAGIQFTRLALAAADRNEGRRNLWLRTLDRFGLGFDS